MVMSLTVWNRLTQEQKAAVEDAAAISDAYFEAIQRNLERQLVTTLVKAGVRIRRMTKEHYLEWLELAQRTAWLEYTKINPRARELLVNTVRTFLEKQGPADDLDDGTFTDVPK
jgi:TRAP-type C4-dicarboxylate transport system substrate-binding protein